MAPETLHDSAVRVAVIHNARKDGKRTQRFAEQLRTHELHVDVIVTHSADEGLTQAQAAIDAGASIIVAAGGDGTVRSVLPALSNGRASLGLLPLGVANDFATELGIITLDDAVRTVAGANERSWDLGQCSYRNLNGELETSTFCTTAGVGLIARALRMSQTGFGQLLKRVLGNGFWAPLVTLSAYLTRARMCELRFGDVRIERPLMLLEISKLRAAGIPLTPDARGDSGYLHTWLVGSPRLWQFGRILYDVLSGSLRHVRGQHVEYVSMDPSQNRDRLSHVSRITIDSALPLPLHLNGDYVGSTPAVFELQASALRVLAPAPVVMTPAFASARDRPSVPPRFSLSAHSQALYP